MEFIKKIVDKSKIISFILVLLALVHRFFGDSKWQYYPLYILALIYFTFIAFYSLDLFTITPRISRWLIGIGIVLIILSVFSLKAFPKTEMLLPTGSFKIGTQTFELEDPTREEFYTAEEDDIRRLKYQVWYPADDIEGLERVRWLSDGNLVPRHLLASATLPAPPFLLDQLAEIDSNSYANAELSEAMDAYPIILISHGWRGFRELHTDFAEDLASHGYFVLSIDHTYGSEAVKFDDGSVAYLNSEALPKMVRPSIFSQKAQKLAITYGKDVKMVLDDLESLNEKFDGKIDLDRIGLLGHSTGGAGDVYTSLRDERVKAIIGMDAWVNPLDLEELRDGLAMPALFLRSKQWAWRESREPLNLLVRNSPDARIIEMDKTKHLDFPMIYMLSPYTKGVGLTGELGGRESSIIQRGIVLDFFDDKLRNKPFSQNYLKEYVETYEHLNFEREDEWFEELSELINTEINKEREKK